MSENLPTLQDIREISLENLAALSDSLNLCFDTHYQLKPGEPVPWQAEHPTANLSGMPGLCVVFKPSDAGGYLITIPQELPLPGWYLEPDESQQSRLQTLGMEWTYGMLPEGFQEGAYSTLVSNDLITAVSWSGTNDQTQMLEIQLIDQQGGAVNKASLWLVGPLDTPPSGDEEKEIEDDISGTQPAGPAAEETYETRLAGQNWDVDDVVARVRRLMPMTVDVSVRLAEKKIGLSQLQNLSPGTLITFPKSCDDLLDMYVNNKLYAQGEAVKIGEKFGLKVNEVGTVKERPPGIFTL